MPGVMLRSAAKSDDVLGHVLGYVRGYETGMESFGLREIRRRW